MKYRVEYYVVGITESKKVTLTEQLLVAMLRNNIYKVIEIKEIKSK